MGKDKLENIEIDGRKLISFLVPSAQTLPQPVPPTATAAPPQPPSRQGQWLPEWVHIECGTALCDFMGNNPRDWTRKTVDFMVGPAIKPQAYIDSTATASLATIYYDPAMPSPHGRGYAVDKVETEYDFGTSSHVRIKANLAVYSSVAWILRIAYQVTIRTAYDYKFVPLR